LKRKPPHDIKRNQENANEKSMAGTFFCRKQNIVLRMIFHTNTCMQEMHKYAPHTMNQFRQVNLGLALCPCSPVSSCQEYVSKYGYRIPLRIPHPTMCQMPEKSKNRISKPRTEFLKI
jgi:hypothetical protein